VVAVSAPSPRDVMEARAWERRRLLAAFLLADPDARVPGLLRPLMVGLVLAVAVVAADPVSALW
jgi:hypothetical protein